MLDLNRPVLRAACYAAVSASLLFGAAARADEYTDQANKSYTEIAKDRRSDLILLPKIAKMAAPPKSVASLEQAILLPAGKAGWAEAQAWATAQPQKDLVAAVASVTQESDWKKAYGFGQPYGIEGIDPAMVQANLYTDLGDPPTLAGAKTGYLAGLDKLAILMHVEATRLASEGNVSDAIDTMINWVYFSRQMCDRQMFQEAAWGLRQLSLAYERVRDIAYVDSKNGSKVDVARLKAAVARLEEPGFYLDLGRMKFPEGNRAAARQLSARCYRSDGSIDERAFAATMSRLGSTTHPLRLFSESGRWRAVAATQARGDEAKSQGTAIFEDWTARWNMPSKFDSRGALDARLSVATTYSKLDKERFALIAASAPDMVKLMDQRELARAENIGTRAALGLQGYATTNHNFPPQITAIRPSWMKEIEADPFNPTARNRGGLPPLTYFVPIRDTADFNGAGNPLEVEVFVRGANFKVSLKDDVFVLYSWGSDYAKNNAKRVENVADRVEGADYLMWPPVISLYRQHKMDQGDFK